MNRKQQAATAILALVIIGSVALMPVNAEQKNANTSGVRHAGLVASAPSPSTELPQDQVRDLTYN